MKKLNILLAIIAVPATLIISGFSEENETNLESNVIIEESIEIVKEDIPPLVNYDYFEELVAEVKSHRAERLVTLETFLAKAPKSKKVILDTRSKAMYDLKHVKGAIHLNFSDFTQGELDKLFALYSGKETQIYIYCNNNFYDSMAKMLEFQDMAFVSKAVMPVIEETLEFSKENDKIKTLALNIPTYINLYGYGYRNVFELNEFIDVNDPRIKFEGTFDDGIVK